MLHLGRVVRRGWFGLGEFATGEAEAACYRDARQVETRVSSTISKYGSGSVPEIDWSSWEKKIAHKDMVRVLREFHERQTAALSSGFALPDAISDSKGDWSLFDAAKKGCEASVTASEEILRNGARALWISANNPSASLATQSEWLDSDQYWQAFVEKHMYYGNYLNISEDPESKEVVASQEAGLLKAWQQFDGRNVARHNNKLLYQRPSYEFYDVYRAPLIEHMMYFLARHGHDFRFFPETMHYRDFAEIYEKKFRVLETLHARRAAFQRASLARETPLELGADDEAHGEQFFENFVASENLKTELCVARLMGNFSFLSDAVPVASEAAMLRVQRLFPQGGQWFDLGEDVSVLFFRPQGGEEGEVDPIDAWNSYLRHMKLTGKAYSPGMNEAISVFHELLAARKEGHDGRWFRASDESSADAFLRRLRSDDPAREIYERYAEELRSRWTAAKAVASDAVAQTVREKAQRYALETREFEAAVLSQVEGLQGAVKEATAEAEKKTSEGVLMMVDLERGMGGGEERMKEAKEMFESEKEKIAQVLNSLKIGK